MSIFVTGGTGLRTRHPKEKKPKENQIRKRSVGEPRTKKNNTTAFTTKLRQGESRTNMSGKAVKRSTGREGSGSMRCKKPGNSAGFPNCPQTATRKKSAQVEVQGGWGKERELNGQANGRRSKRMARALTSFKLDDRGSRGERETDSTIDKREEKKVGKG